MDAMFPAIILALSLPALSDKRLRLTAVIGNVIAVATTPIRRDPCITGIIELGCLYKEMAK